MLIITCLVTYFYYWPGIISTSFQSLNCIDIGPEGASDVRFYADPVLSCSSGRYHLIRRVGIVTLVLSGVLFCVKLRRNKHSLNDERFLKRYGFIYRGYKDEYHWWEFMVLIRKNFGCNICIFRTRPLSYVHHSLSHYCNIQCFEAAALSF